MEIETDSLVVYACLALRKLLLVALLSELMTHTRDLSIMGDRVEY